MISKHPSYQRCVNATKRCYDPSQHNYRHYGGRGIRVHEEWLGAEGRKKFLQYLDDNLGPCPEGWTLDRIDSDKHYEPGNLRWASRSMQERNKNTVPADVIEAIQSRYVPCKVTYKMLAEEYGLTLTRVSRIANRTGGY